MLCSWCGRRPPPTRLSHVEPSSREPAAVSLSRTANWSRRALAVFALALAITGYVLARRWVASRIGPPFLIAIDNPSAAPYPALAVTCCRQMEEVVFIHLTGKVENIGAQPLKNVLAHARFFDRDGREIASAQAPVFNVELIPGDRPTEFRVTTPVNLAIASAVVDFREPAGPPIPARYRAFNYTDGPDGP
jgi:hypothetical protein